MDDDVTRVVDEPSATRGDRRPEEAAVRVGSRVGRYRVGERLGVGGMGEVHVAEDPELGRRVALKFVRVGKGHRGAGRARLLREAQALAQLNHPNVVTVYDAGTYGDDRLVYIAMEYIEGQTLRDWLEAPRRWPEILDVLLRAGAGLAAAHAAGLVHRDFKPQNVMLEHAGGRVRVLDFGLAQAHDASSEGAGNESDGADEHDDLTQSGTVLGTPSFMAPEQFSHSRLDARTDQFSFCVTAYRALYGVAPFAGHGFAQLRHSVVAGRLEPAPVRTAVPDRVHAVLARGLSRDPSDRWPEMHALLQALAAVRPRGRRLAVAGPAVLGAGVAIAAGALWATSGDARCEASRDKLAGVWDDDRRTQVRAAFEATELPYAARMLSTAEEGLDEFAQHWLAKRTDVCRAAQDRDAASARRMDDAIACLDRRLLEAGALVDVLAAADVPVVDNAADSIARLRPVTVCDAAGNGLRVDPPPPELVAVVHALEADVARIDALTFSGKYQEAEPLAREALTRATGTGYSPIIADVALRTGQLAERLGDGEEAQRAYGTGREAAAASGDARNEARALIGMASVTATRLAQPEAALSWVRHAEAAVARAGSPADLRIYLEVSTGNAHFLAGDPAQAAAHHRRALELGAELPGTGLIGTAARNNLAGALAAEGQYVEALAVISDALRDVRARLGPDHPVVAKHYDNRGSLLMYLERYDEAEAAYAAALAIYRSALGEEHAEVGRLLTNLGVNHLKSGNVQEALEHIERGVAIKRRTAPDHPSLATSINNLAEALRQAGRPEDALPRLDEAARIWEAAGGPKAPELVFAMAGYAEVHLELGPPRACLPYVERGLEIAAQGRSHPMGVADFKFVAARCLWAVGQRAEALQAAAEARDGYAATKTATHSGLAKVDAWLAKK